MRKIIAFALGASIAALTGGAVGQTKVAIGYSGWTGFAPLTLAKEAGIFKRNGLDVELRKIPQKDRHLAIASATSNVQRRPLKTWISWNAKRRRDETDLPDGQELWRRRDGGPRRHPEDRRPEGQDHCGVRARDRAVLHARVVLKKNGLSVKDVTVVNLEPAAAAQAFVAGQNDAAMTLRALPVDGARESAGGQDHRDHARLSDW